MRDRRTTLDKGVYLVIDPSMEEALLMDKLRLILKEKVAAVQVWDNFREGQDIPGLIDRLCALCHAHETPVLINNRWELGQTSELDGVHFDEMPEDLERVRQSAGRRVMLGITVNNDLELIRRAEAGGMDYISFCSMFPSTTATSCDLVPFEVVRKAKEIFSGPIFLAGGIHPENMHKLNELDYAGVAVVSGIMSSDRPGEAVRAYQQHIKRIR
ncbi:thiamine phosphate synthase [Roseivirga sp. BDSF3-8]|uniref:thiamine phosphate synthase n=1 Tax=Roseivirga sp. BDSF3-8 TaxID=3241598 RepID=UPI003531F30F